ncbi:Mediator complex subunit 24 [Aphelenchoides besseyi]|nr:Mediator complex subunit 24 [Aphelenchoides besseyi]KAI6207573.1 Mediator complex subunit 24 [Aphelenchoides besseyi]
MDVETLQTNQLEAHPSPTRSSNSSSTDEFLAEPLGPLRRLIFNCFCSRVDPSQFIAKLNNLQNGAYIAIDLKPEITVQSLIELGCANNQCNLLLFPYLDALLECKHFDSKFYVLALTSFCDLNKPNCALSFVTKVGDLLRVIDCDFRDDKSLHQFCDIYVSALRWLCNLLTKIFETKREQAVFLAKPLVEHVIFFSEDHTAKYVMYYTNFLAPEFFTKLTEQTREVVRKMQEMSKSLQISRDIRESVESLPALIESLPTKPNFPVNHVETYRFGTSQPRPTILTLVSVYASFRVIHTNEEIADALINIGEIMLMNRTQILVDLFRGAFLGLLEGNGSLPPERRQLAEVFMYKRVCQIAELMVESNQCTVEQLHQALTKLASNSALLNALDKRQMENTFAAVLEGNKIAEFLGEEQYANLMSIRVSNIKEYEKLQKEYNDYVSPFPSGNIMDNACHPRSRYRSFLKAESVVKKIRLNPESIDMLAVELVDYADVELVDLVLGCLCADNKICGLASRLSNLAASLEHASDDKLERIQCFDSTFIILTRIRQIFYDLRLEEMTDGLTKSTFFRWSEKYNDCLDLKKVLPVNEEIKQSTFMTHFARLKLGQAFWNDSWDFEHLIAHAPAIGEALLEDIGGPDGNKIDEDTIKNILLTFGGVSSMFLCLCQWLETVPLSEHVQQLAQALRDVSRKNIEKLDSAVADSDLQAQRQNKRWKFTIKMVLPTLDRIVNGPRAQETTYTWLQNIARRDLACLDPTEVPNMKMLKSAFLYATQQGWASPDVVLYIERMTKHMQHSEWIKCWFMQMVKQNNADELEPAAELCIAVATTKAVVCLITISHMIIEDTVFNRLNTGFNHTWVLARMLVRVLLILYWAEDRRRDKRRRFLEWRREQTRKRKSNSELNLNDLSSVNSTDNSLLSAPSATNSPPDMNMSTHSDQNDTVNKTIQRVFHWFFKEVKPSLVRAKVAFICSFMLELAMSPAGGYRQRLIELIPDEMMFALVRLEPTCFNLPLLMKIYDTNNVDHRLLVLQIVCMLRKIYLT